MTGIPTNNGFEILAPRYADGRMGKLSGGRSVPFDSVEEANAAINPAFRSVGLVVNITIGGVPAQYWYAANITDEGLVLKDGGAINSTSFVNDANSLPTIQRIVTNAGNFDTSHNAANSRFVPTGTGATPRLVSDKLKETVSIFDFGAIKNTDAGGVSHTAANNAAILAANIACAASGQTLVLGDYDDVLDFSVGFSLAGTYSVISNGWLRLAAVGASGLTFITIGGIADGVEYAGTFKFRRISSVAYSDSIANPAFTGVRFINVVKSFIDFTGEGIELFGTGVEFKGINSTLGVARGCAYNLVNLPIVNYAQRSVYLNAAGNDGFVNSNMFTGGGSYLQAGAVLTYGISMAGAATNASINSNLFLSFVFEMGGANNVPVYADGSIADNAFRDFRLEATANPSNVFFSSTNVNVRRNFFQPLFNDTGNYIAKCDVVSAANGTFNVYRQEMDLHTQHFASKFKAHKFYPVTTGSLTTIKGLQGYQLSAGTLNTVTGFSAADATIASASFKLRTIDRYFGKMITMGKNEYLLINTLQAESTLLAYVYLVPYFNGSIVTHTNSGGGNPVVTSTFVKCLKNAFESISSINANIMGIQSGDRKTNNSHLVWFDPTLVDSVLVLFGRGIDGALAAQDITWQKIEIATGSNVVNSQTLEAQQFVFTDNDRTGIGTEESPLLSKITATLSAAGSINLPAGTPSKGVVLTGTAADTVSLGTTVSGTDVLNAVVLDANGKYISSNVLYYTAAQLLYISGNANPVTVILPI